MHIETRNLPQSIQEALKSVGYARKDIRVEARETISMACPASDGCRAFVILLDIDTGRKETKWGSWGGANIFNRDNAVDLDTETRPMPVGACVIQGSEGGNRPVYATVYLHPSRIALELGDGSNPELSKEEQAVIDAMGYTSAYRKPILDKYPKAVDSLVAKGLIKRNKAGACSITTEGKNARKSKY